MENKILNILTTLNDDITFKNGLKTDNDYSLRVAYSKPKAITYVLYGLPVYNTVYNFGRIDH